MRQTPPKEKYKRRNDESGITTLLPLIPSTPSQITFQDGFQEELFWFFCTETSRRCSSGWSEPIWQNCVPKACYTENCILNCAVAIAALDRSHRLESTGASRDQIETHHHYALRQYNDAIKGIREVLKRTHHLRTILIASILIHSFENLNGNSELAMIHIRAAGMLLGSWWCSKKTRTSSAVGCSPAPTEIEDEILETYMRLDNKIFLFLSEANPLIFLLRHMASNKLPPLPDEFLDFEEQGQKLGRIINNALPFIKSATNVFRLPEADRAKILDRDGVQLIKPAVLDELYDWQNSFQPTLSFAKNTPLGKTYVLRAAILRLISVRLSITIRMVFFDPKNPSLYNLFLPEFGEIVTLVSSIVRSWEYRAGVEFRTGILSGLNLVFTTCPDRGIKRAALNVLKKMKPRQEGLWDTAKILETGEALLTGHGARKVELQEKGSLIQIVDT